MESVTKPMTIDTSTPQDNHITMCAGETEILKLTKDAFIFKGEVIEDAGEAHKAFLKTMEMMQNV